MGFTIHEKRQLAEQIAREQLNKSGQYRFGIPLNVLNAKANEFMRLSDKELQKMFNEYFQSSGLNEKPKDLWDSMGLNLEQKKKAESFTKNLQKQINKKYIQPTNPKTKNAHSKQTTQALPDDVKKETRQFLIAFLKQAYGQKAEEFRSYLLNNKANFAEGAMELHDLGAKVADGLTELGIVIDRSDTRAEIREKLIQKQAEIEVLEDSINDEKAFNELFKKYFNQNFDYQTTFDYICASSEFSTKDAAKKIEKFNKNFENLTKENLKSADDYMGNANGAGGLLDLGFNVALMYVSGGTSAIAKYAQMTAKGGSELAENAIVKVAGKNFAQSNAGQAISQSAGIVAAQTTSAGLNAVAFQGTKTAELVGESIATGDVNTDKVKNIVDSTEGLFKFGYIGGAISGPLGMQVKNLTTKMLNSKPVINHILTKGITNKPTPLTSVLKDLSEYSDAVGEVLKFGTEFSINAGYMAYDDNVSYTDAMANLAQMDGVSKMVLAMLGAKNMSFLTPEKVQKIKTDLAGYKVNIAVKGNKKVYSIKDAQGKETVLATPEELFMFILDKEAKAAGIKSEARKASVNESETKNDANNITSKTNKQMIELSLEKIETIPNQCGILELKDINGQQAGTVTYDLREINGQKVLHFEGLESKISGAGVGSKLIQKLVKLSKDIGAEGRIVATASPMMSTDGKLTNLGFYYKLGFKATDATKDAEIRQLLAEGKEIPIYLNVFTDIELTPEGIVRNTLTKKEAKKLEPMQKQYPEIVNDIIEKYAGKISNEELIEMAGKAISEKINNTLPQVQVVNYTPKVEIEMPINETRFDVGDKTLDVKLPNGVSEGVPIPTKIKAELGTTSIHLAEEYKKALDSCKKQAENTFGATKLSTVKEVSTRPKGAASIEPKLEKGLRKSGHLDYNAAKECIGDAVGARIITKNLRKLSDKEITDRINNMKVDNKSLTTEQKELLKKYIYEDKFDSDAKKLEGFYLFEQFTRPLVEERTSEVVNELLLSIAKFKMLDKGLTIEQIKKEGILVDETLLERLKTDDSIEPLEVLQINNYTGLYGLPEFSYEQISELKGALEYEDVIFTRADIGDNLYPIHSGFTSPEEVLKANNGELPKSIKSSGYRTAQMNVVFKDGTLGEIQFRGEETNKIGEYEHIAYDLRQGKNTLGPLFNDFKEAISKLSPNEYSEYNNYLEACYNYYNRIELGLPANKPKLPSKFNPILSEENMKNLHDINETRLNELKKDFKERKIR